MTLNFQSSVLNCKTKSQQRIDFCLILRNTIQTRK